MHMRDVSTAIRGAWLLGAMLALSATTAQAINFTFGEQGEATINTTITVGSGWRMENRASDLVGKANLNPNVCAGQYQSC